MSKNTLHQPRTGIAGFGDTFIGPGATRSENALIIGVALAAAALQVAYALIKPLPWSGVQVAVAALLSLDLWGGIPGNALLPARRWYHRPSQGRRQLLIFTAIHAFHAAVLVLFFRPGDWAFFAVIYGWLMIAAVLIVVAPLRLQQGLAFLLTVAGCALALIFLVPTPGLEWFAPVFHIKLLAAHLQGEGPA